MSSGRHEERILGLMFVGIKKRFMCGKARLRIQPSDLYDAYRAEHPAARPTCPCPTGLSGEGDGG